MPSDQFTLGDYRRQLMSMAQPPFFMRFTWWIAMLFQPHEMCKEIGNAFNDPQVKSHFRKEIGIIDAMTPDERAKPRSIDRPRLIRIAHGAGVSLDAVENLLGTFESMRISYLTWRNPRDKST